MNLRTLVASVIAVIAAVILLPSTPAQAAGEEYKWSNNLRSSLVMSGGNIRLMGVDGNKVTLPQRSGSENEYVSETVNTKDSVCDEYGATITVSVVNDQVTFVNAFCNSNSGEVLYTDWALGTVAPASPPGGSPGNPAPPKDDPRIKDTKEEYSFVGPTGDVIRACKGVWYGFNPNGNGCVNFDYSEQSGSGDVLTWKLEASPVTDDCDGPNAGNYIFHIDLAEPRVIEDDAIAASVYQQQHGGCSNDMKNIGIGVGGAASISITNADQLESLAGIPVESGPADPVSLCKVEHGLSWILCPLMNTVASLNDAAFEQIEKFLISPPMVQDGVSLADNGVYKTWSMMRNIANILFVIVFLVVIYSQLTSAGISNYGIKKMLPKMIIGVILINTSFWLAALAVDISNVVGSSIYDVLHGISGVPGGAEGDSRMGANEWAAATGAVLVGSGIAVMAGLVILLPLALSALFMIIGLVFILAFRHAMVFILIAAAPIAILAYLLPNTEGIFKSWFKIFRVLLYIYPVVAFIMGVSGIAASVVFNMSQPPASGDSVNTPLMLVAVAMPAMAIFVALMLAKTMGNVGGKLGLTNPFGGMIDAAKNRAGMMGKNADGAMSQTKFGSMIGGVGQSRRVARDYKQQMKDEKYGNHAKARVLRSRRGKAAFVAQGAAQQSFNSAKTQAEIADLKNNKPLHVDAVVDNLELDSVKSNLQTTVDQQAATAGTAANLAVLSKRRTELEGSAAQSKVQAAFDREVAAGSNKSLSDAARDKWLYEQSSASSSGMTLNANAEALSNDPALQAIAGGADPIGADRAKAVAQHTINKRQQEIVSMAKETMSRDDHSKLMATVKDKSRSTEERMAAAGIISKNSYRKGHIELMEYLGAEANSTDSSMPDIQMQVTGDSSGMSAIMGDTELGQLQRGEFKVKDIDRGSLSVPEHLMLKRLELGKFSPEKLASMDIDDLAVIDELHTKGHLTGTAKDNIDEWIDDLRKPENSAVYAKAKSNSKDIFNKIR